MNIKFSFKHKTMSKQLLDNLTYFYSNSDVIFIGLMTKIPLNC